MYWTKEKPRDGGYYWYIPTGKETEDAHLEKGKAEIVRTESDHLVLPNSVHRYQITGFDGLWNGPITVPPFASIRCEQCRWQGNENELYMIPVDDEAEEAILNEKTCPKCRGLALKVI